MDSLANAPKQSFKSIQFHLAPLKVPGGFEVQYPPASFSYHQYFVLPFPYAFLQSRWHLVGFGPLLHLVFQLLAR